MGAIGLVAVVLWAAVAAPAVGAMDNGVGRTPVMGWSGYNAIMQGSGECSTNGASLYNETTFLQTMDVLVSSGLRDLGYTYLNADDCWIAKERDAEGRLQADPSRFPSGMAFLAGEAHKRGLKLGLYAAAGNLTCRNFPGSEGHEALDAATFASWGADFAKLDACHDAPLWGPQYTAWSRALNASERPIVFSCSWPTYYDVCIAQGKSDCGPNPWLSAIVEICNMWRYGDDLQPTWSRPGELGGSGIKDIIEFAAAAHMSRRAPIGPGQFNDADFLVVGCPTDGPCEGGYLPGPPTSDVEQRTQMSMWAIIASPLIIGSDIRGISKTAMDTLSNKDAIAISQDPAGIQGHRVVNNSDGTQVWVRPLTPAHGEAKAVAVALLNAGDAGVVTISVTPSQLGFPAGTDVLVLDVWAGSSSQTHLISSEVGAHATTLLRVSTVS